VPEVGKHYWKNEQVTQRVPHTCPLLEIPAHRIDRLCGLVVRVPGYRSGGPGSLPGPTRFSEK
jgi:hypothetical protein